LTDLASDDGSSHLSYAIHNLLWHCENTPPSAYSQLREEILNFPFDRPDSCFRTSGGTSLFVYVPRFLSFINTFVRPIFFGCVTQCIEHIWQPFDDAGEIYNKNLALVLDFFASKLHLYYSSSRLTLLLTFLSSNESDYLQTDAILFPSRLKITDEDPLHLRNIGSDRVAPCWHIFQDFLNSNDPLALDERRYTVAALACLKILFEHHQPPVSRITWFSQNSRVLRESMEDHSQWRHKVLQVESYQRGVTFYWHLRTRDPNPMPQNQHIWDRFYQFRQESFHQHFRSNHLLFLLPKSAYSHDILNFARYRVFRFGYLHRMHPKCIKRAIFALAKYIQRVTGETAEVRACESVWGRKTWFTAQ